MPDRYASFGALAAHERADIDFRVVTRRTGSTYCIAAPHGGGIEPGTSELAIAIAATEHSLYVFEGRKRSNNRALHITSTRFDEPECLALVANTEAVLTLHGEASDRGVEVVFLGGLDGLLSERVHRALREVQFEVRPHAEPRLHGFDPSNLCNRGWSGAGVQLELSRGLRRTFFASLTESGRAEPTARFHAFASAVRSALAAPGRRSA
jgi:phage replication-related protein YjqB (UPF0714/DUF867 family)